MRRSGGFLVEGPRMAHGTTPTVEYDDLLYRMRQVADGRTDAWIKFAAYHSAFATKRCLQALSLMMSYIISY